MVITHLTTPQANILGAIEAVEAAVEAADAAGVAVGSGTNTIAPTTTTRAGRVIKTLSTGKIAKVTKEKTGGEARLPKVYRLENLDRKSPPRKHISLGMVTTRNDGNNSHVKTRAKQPPTHRGGYHETKTHSPSTVQPLIIFQ